MGGRMRSHTGGVAPSSRVLIVDDHPDTVYLLRYLLSSANHDVVGAAGTGEEAVELARDRMPEVVILDFDLPGINGRDAARAIRATHPQIKIIGISAVLRRAPDWADAFVDKSDLVDLPEIVEALISHRV